MKIDQKKFDKLNQLDRIEFRQKEDRIKDKYEVGLLITAVNTILIGVGFILLIAIGVYNINIESSRILFNLLGSWSLGKVLIIFIGVSLLGDFLIIHFRKEKLNSLEEEYFNMNPKKK